MRRKLFYLISLLILATLAYTPQLNPALAPCTETVQADGTVRMSSIVACYGDE